MSHSIFLHGQPEVEIWDDGEEVKIKVGAATVYLDCTANSLILQLDQAKREREERLAAQEDEKREENVA